MFLLLRSEISQITVYYFRVATLLSLSHNFLLRSDCYALDFLKTFTVLRHYYVLVATLLSLSHNFLLRSDCYALDFLKPFIALRSCCYALEFVT
jgi:hypothetical protein